MSFVLREKSAGRGLIAAGFAAVLLMTPGVGRATPVNFNEATGGDLPETSPWPIFTLDVGANTISGHSLLRADSVEITAYDFDSFQVVVPEGDVLTSMSLSIEFTEIVNPGSVTFDTFFDQGPSPYTVLKESTVSIYPTSTNPIADLATPLPVGPGQYLLFQGLVQGTTNENVNWDYTYTFNVAASGVPLPGSASMTAALAAAGLLRRNRGRG